MVGGSPAFDSFLYDINKEICKQVRMSDIVTVNDLILGYNVCVSVCRHACIVYMCDLIIVHLIKGEFNVIYWLNHKNDVCTYWYCPNYSSMR